MAVTFSDLHTESGLKSLESFLSGKTYISGDQITKDDVKVYAAVLEKPSADLYPSASKWYECVASKLSSSDLEVDYQSEEIARIIHSTLAVDKELQPDKVRRVMSVSNGKLSVRFEATEARFLRASYSAFVDALTLATKTIEQFGGNSN